MGVSHTTSTCRFTQGSTKKSLEQAQQQQQRGTATGIKEKSSSADKTFKKSDQKVTDQHITQLPDHTAIQQRSVLSTVYSDDLFAKWPPPAEMEGRLEADEIDQTKAEMRGQPMQGPRATSEEVKGWGLCVEQYHVHDTYWLWQTKCSATQMSVWT